MQTDQRPHTDGTSNYWKNNLTNITIKSKVLFKYVYLSLYKKLLLYHIYSISI